MGANMKKRYKCKQCYAINIDNYDFCVSCGAPLKRPKSTLFRVVFQVLGLMGFYLGLQTLFGVIVTIPVVYRNINSIEIVDGLAIFSHFSDAILIAATLSALIFIAIVGIYYYRRRHSVKPLYRFDQIRFSHIFWASVMGFGCIFLSQIIINVSEAVGILNMESMEGFEELMALMFGQSPVWLILLAVGIVAPIAEELLFRGLIFHLLNRHLNIKVALILQGVLFGLFHMNLVQGVYASVLGVVLGIAYILTGSLWVPIVIHIVNNSVAIFLPEAWMNEPVLYAFLLSLMLLVPLGVWALYRTNSKKFILDLNA